MLKFSVICKPKVIKQISLDCFTDITKETLLQITLQISGANTLSRMSVPVFVVTNLNTNQSNDIGWFMLRKYIQLLQLTSYDKT